MMRYNTLREIIYLCIASVIMCASCSTTPSSSKEKKSATVLRMDTMFIKASEQVSKAQFEKATAIAREGLMLATNDKNDSMIAKFYSTTMKHLMILWIRPDWIVLNIIIS